MSKRGIRMLYWLYCYWFDYEPKYNPTYSYAILILVNPVPSLKSFMQSILFTRFQWKCIQQLLKMLIIRHHQIITLSFLTQYLDYVRSNHFRSKGYFKILYTQAIDIELPKSKFEKFSLLFSVKFISFLRLLYYF